MTDIILKVIMGVLLLLCGIQDVLKMKIVLWIVIIGGVLIGICVPFCSAVSYIDRSGGILVGVIVIVISLATHGKIGLGDGILLCTTGLGLGFWGNLELFAIALLLAAVLSILLLIFHLADRKKELPFIPFLFIGYTFLCIIENGAGA